MGASWSRWTIRTHTRTHTPADSVLHTCGKSHCAQPGWLCSTSALPLNSTVWAVMGTTQAQGRCAEGNPSNGRPCVPSLAPICEVHTASCKREAKGLVFSTFPVIEGL